MKILGLDVSSTSTGWSVVDSKLDVISLIEFGLIRGDSSMSAIQRLYFLGNELKKIIEKQQPDEIAIEETVLVRGPKIMRILARFSGVAIFQCYSYQKKELYVFEPAKWKKNIGIGGHALKAEVQLYVCTKFNLLSLKQLADYQDKILEIEKQVFDHKTNIKKSNDKLTRKEVNKQVKIIEKQYVKMSTDIFSDCGISNDIADSAGVALAAVIQINNDKEFDRSSGFEESNGS
jgi:crossover junction endodeoxyribonuclease RuvC